MEGRDYLEGQTSIEILTGNLIIKMYTHSSLISENLQMELAEQQEALVDSRGERMIHIHICLTLLCVCFIVPKTENLYFCAVLIDAEYEQLLPREEKSTMVSK